MDKSKKIIATTLCVFMIVNVWTTMSLKKQVKNLQNEIGRMHSNLSNTVMNTGQGINNLRNDLVSKIEKGESLLSSFGTEVEHKNGQLVFTVKVAPKEKRTDEIIFLSLGGEKKETVSVNGLEYTAAFALKMPQKITPTVSFESSTGVRQEVLPEIYPDELLSLGYESSWEIESNSPENNNEMFMLKIYTLNENSRSLLSETPAATIVIQDLFTDAEIGRKKIQLTESKTSGSISFNADLSEYQKKKGAFTIWIEIKADGGIFYREQVASFNYEGEHSSGTSSGTGVLYPVW